MKIETWLNFKYTCRTMPVTKTAKRALRSSKRKESVNKILITKMEIALRKVKKTPTVKLVSEATSLVDKAAKRKIFHKNKAARMKSALSKLLPKKTTKAKTKK